MIKSKTTNIYWKKEMDEHITAFNKSTDEAERNAIYDTHIRKPLEKLVEYITNKWKWDYIPENKETIQKMCVGYCMLQIPKYVRRVESNSFGYFSVIVKNYLINWNDASYKQKQQQVEIYTTGNDEDDAKAFEILMTENARVINDITDFVKFLINSMETRLIPSLKHKPKYQAIINAVIQVMKENDFNGRGIGKRDMYKHLQKMTGFKQPRIANVSYILMDYYNLCVDAYNKGNDSPNPGLIRTRTHRYYVSLMTKKNKYHENIPTTNNT